MPPERVTVLTACQGLATKTIGVGDDGTRHVTRGYNAGKTFTWREENAANIHDLAGIVQRCGPQDLIIRGTIHDDKRHEEVVRRKLEYFGESGKKAETSWVMADFDSIEEHAFLTMEDDPDALVEWVIEEYLPEEFSNVSCFYQFSSSAGIKPGIRVHLFFWLDRPVAGRDIDSYMKAHAPEVDRALFGDVQAHYVAAPIFDKCYDPIPRRNGFLECAEDFVTLPEINPKELAEFAREHHGTPIHVHGFRGWLKAIGDGPGGAGFHEPIRNGVMDAVRGANETRPRG